MAFYTICGKPDCVSFAHAAYVAQYLLEHLPNFKYKKIEKTNSDWPKFVASLNTKYKWYMVKSPIIWKEISTWGGKPYLIGGLGEFWEYCYCYYGLESSIPRADLQKLTNDNVKFFEEEQEKSSKQEQNYNVVVSIFGAVTNDTTEYLMEEFLHIPAFLKGNGFFIKLYEEEIDSEDLAKDRKYLEIIVKRFNDLALFGSRNVVKIVCTEEEAIANTDLLIILEDFSRKKGEDPKIWENRCLTRISMLSDTINISGKRPLRVIFCDDGPTSLMATCMVEYCTVLVPANIVVLAADKGLSVISAISEMTGVQVAKIGAPPVWGFIGHNEYVDEANILFKAHIYRPYKRALTAPEGSTLPLGTVVPELRLMSYLVPDQHDEITRIVQERKVRTEARLHRKPFFQKLRALESLLKIWYEDEISDQIISLGVCSNGSYGIPAGIVFSQPSIQDKKRRWRPFPNFPLMNSTTTLELEKLIEEAVNIIEKVLFLRDVSNYSSSDTTLLRDGTPRESEQ